RSQMPGKGFEGIITETIQIPGIGDLMRGKADSSGAEESAPGFNAGALANLQMKMYVRENKVAYDISMLGGLLSMRSIIDRNNRTLTALLPNKVARVIELRALDTMRGRVDDSIRAHDTFLDSLATSLPQPTGHQE